MKKIGVKILVASMLLTVLAAVTDLLSGSPLVAHQYVWIWAANVLVTASLFPLIWKNELRGGALVFATFLVYYVIGNFNILIEAYIFNVTDRPQTLRTMLWGIPTFLAATWLLVRVIGTEGDSRSAQFRNRGIGSWIVKAISGNFLYFLFYLTAGLILQMSYPPLMDYYGDKLPTVATIFGTQLLIRGFLFVGVAIIIDRYSALTSWQKTVVTGAIFAVIGGIAPLLAPNELMPQHIRIAHGFEVGISNFLYGVVLHRIIRRKLLGEVESSVAGGVSQSKAVAL